MTCHRPIPVLGLIIAFSVGTLLAQQLNTSSEDLITPERLGLPNGSSRTSQPFVTRIYKTDDHRQILTPQPEGYPFTIASDYTLNENEKPRVHEGVDVSSRSAPGQRPSPLDFKAGINGVVVRAGGGHWGTIAVQLADGDVLQYLHTSASYVKVGDVVTPDTRLGKTGRTGAGVIHLHVQARDKHKHPISPDLAFRLGQKKLATPIKPGEDAGDDFDPDRFPVIEPEVVNGVVHPYRPKTKWVSEVIGGGGKVQIVLGEFPTYPDAFHCSIAWSKAHPDDLRLTREREIKLAGGQAP
jgi:murein DD-endopeptidase MepM/ murein hydrolase activator NlpD